MDTAEAVLRELYRLYLWRFEIAKEEASIPLFENRALHLSRQLDIDPQVVESAFDTAENTKKSVKKKLLQYGTEKKAAWERVPKVLDK